jgi:hypothetical protein
MGGGLKLICLRREYFSRVETGAPLQLNRGGFFSDGHRLSSLYRRTRIQMLRLINRYSTSFLFKYSNPTLSKGADL